MFNKMVHLLVKRILMLSRCTVQRQKLHEVSFAVGWIPLLLRNWRKCGLFNGQILLHIPCVILYHQHFPYTHTI